MQKQIITTANGDFAEHPKAKGYVCTGFVSCPFCSARTSVYTPKKLGLEFSEAGCEHSLGVVSAGDFQSAVHFETKVSRNSLDTLLETSTQAELTKLWEYRKECERCKDWERMGLSATCPSHDAVANEIQRRVDAIDKLKG